MSPVAQFSQGRCSIILKCPLWGNMGHVAGQPRYDGSEHSYFTFLHLQGEMILPSMRTVVLWTEVLADKFASQKLFHCYL